LLRQLTSSELTEWMAYFMIEEEDRAAAEAKERNRSKHNKR
jgi:hypothetical protein